MQAKKILNIGGVVKKTDYDAKTTETDGKIPIITSLDTTSALMQLKI